MLGRRRDINPDELRQMLVCILGAGASVECGPPTSLQLARKFISWGLDDRPPPSPQNARKPKKKPQTPGDLILALWNYLSDALGRSPNIEELAVACWSIHSESLVHARTSPIQELPDVFRTVNPAHLEIIEFDLVAQLKNEWLKVDENKVDYLGPIIKLESIFPSETLKIFTLNYDVSIEIACKRLNVACTDGFLDGTVSYNSVPIFTDTARAFADGPLAVYQWEGENETLDARVELFKLHGSVNWFEEFSELEAGNNYEVYRQIRNITNARPFSARSIAGPLAKVNSMSDQVLWWSGPLGETQKLYFPRLVFGTTDKYLPTVPFARMYELLYRYLRRSRLCLIVGYSFQDDHVNALLSDAFNRQGDRFVKALNVVIVDSDDRQKPRHVFLARNDERIWRIIGPASLALASPEFECLCYDLATKGCSDLPHRIAV